MKDSCGCCEGVQKLTPATTVNRPGLDTLSYRVGTHATFLETMKARLSGLSWEVPAGAGRAGVTRIYPLQRLKTREQDDSAIALLDAWATVADVLTFYQERIANEGYLRTATERRSVLELARLVGYAPRPGVAASVFLAFTLESGYRIEIPAGTRAQSLPGPGQLPQPFETAEPLNARDQWNLLAPRMSRPQRITRATNTVYLKGTATDLEPNDPLLFIFGSNPREQVVRRVAAVTPDPAADRTKVTLHDTVREDASVAGVVDEIERIAERFVDPAKYSISRSPMASRVVRHLKDVRTVLMQDMPAEELARRLHESLAFLQRQLVQTGPGYRTLRAWLDGLISELERVESHIRTGGAGGDGIRDGPTNGETPPPAGGDGRGDGESAWTKLERILQPLSIPRSVQPRSAQRLVRRTEDVFSLPSDTPARLLTTLRPALRPTLYAAWQNLAAEPGEVEVFALRVAAPLFGHNAPKKPLKINPNTGDVLETGEWPIIEIDPRMLTKRTVHEEAAAVYLDAAYEKILPGSWVVVQTVETNLTDDRTLVAKARRPNASLSRAEYGITGKTTKIELADPTEPTRGVEWPSVDLDDPRVPPQPDDFAAIRQTTVYAQSEPLELAEEPIEAPVSGGRIELTSLYDGLLAGQWLIISGERADVEGVKTSELVMLAGVEQGFDSKLPGDKTHSTLVLANPLAYSYVRAAVKIYGNVVPSSHGETRAEILGSGDQIKVLQQFALAKPPLTYLSAPTPEGAESTLRARVNDLLWHEVKTLVGLGPRDRAYIIRIDDDGTTRVVFGNGRYGSRLPSGAENVKAIYRTGIGKVGNVPAGQITLLAIKPLGVKSVINPLPASGGADRETRDQARRSTPLAVTALERLVSVADYADFARIFAGIGKASATRLSEGRRRVVHVTVAGADDIPIEKTSDLYRNLVGALGRSGDPHQPVQVDLRERMLLVIGAQVRLHPDYLWESVEPQIRRALLDAFSFERRELGQDVTLSEVMSVVQRVEGVAYVDVDILDAVREEVTLANLADLVSTLGLRERIAVDVARIDPASPDPEGRIRPAQLAYLSPEVPDTLLLTARTT